MDATFQQDGIQSLETGLDIFKALHEMGRPVELSELAAALKMHRSKLHRYLVSLVRTGLVAQDGDRRYRSGPYALQLMGEESTLARSRESALLAMPELSQKIRETVFLSVWRGRRPFIVHFEEPPKAISVRPAVNTELPLLNSATGRAFAAFLPSKELEVLLDTELTALVPASQRESRRRAYLKELSGVRKRGVSRSLAERHRSVISLSAPLFGNGDKALLAVTAFGLRGSFDASWNGEPAHELRNWADKHARPFQASK